MYACIMYIYIYVYICMCTCIRNRIHTYIYIYTCTYIYVYIYIYISKWPSAPRHRALGRLPANQQPTKQPNSDQNSSKIDEKSSKNLFPRVSWRGSGGHVGLKNRSWEPSWGGLGAILGPRANQDPQG